jgi:hypothetical protein
VFSDILGRNQIFAGANINGQVYDFGGQFAYINQKGRWNFAVGVSHIPYQYGFYTQQGINLTGPNNTVIPGVEVQNDIIRNFQDGVQVITSYPFSKINRIEFGTGAVYNYFRVDRYYTDYDIVGNYVSSGHAKIPNDQEAQQLASQGFYTNLNSYALFQLNTAFVGDNSFFGITSPLNGFRYRFGMEYNFGTYKFFAPTIDMRKYVRLKPVTLAARFFGYGRIGSSNALYPLYVGYPFYIRGYEANSFYNTGNGSTNGFTIDQLSGNRIGVANFEIRLPFTGPEKLAQIPSKFLFSDLNLFFDAGLAWNGGDLIKFESSLQQTGSVTDPVTHQVFKQYEKARIPATSIGISLRINVFGAFILEPYYAFPFQRNDISKPVFGLNFAPGW